MRHTKLDKNRCYAGEQNTTKLQDDIVKLEAKGQNSSEICKELKCTLRDIKEANLAYYGVFNY